ncbi:hypothetical protein [Tardiphaga sp.]|uniref:hypothetical protein n=1 Tax=Tardiphaga sp. TaxID=1926292 RepID=UPI0037DA1176
MREQLAQHHGFQLLEAYGEEQAAAFLEVNLSWMKEMRAANKIPYVRYSERKIRYRGWMIADIMILGDRWADTQKDFSSSAPTISASGQEAQHGIDAGKKDVLPNASASAQRILKKPSKS